MPFCRVVSTRAAPRSRAKTANTITPARLDMGFLDFVGIDPEALKKQLTKSDTEVLEWINANAKHKRTMPEILEWSAYQDTPLTR